MKKNIDVARAWRDEDYFQSLTEEERAGLGTHPSGATALEDEVLKSIAGGCCTTDFNSPNYTPACTPCPKIICD